METIKRYVVAYQPEGGIGWIWEDSFDSFFDAFTFSKQFAKVRIINQFKNDQLVYQA